MTATHTLTLFAGGTFSAGYTISSTYDGSFFTLINGGVVGGMTAAYAGLGDAGGPGDGFFNGSTGRMLANPETGIGIRLKAAGRIENRLGGLISGGQAIYVTGGPGSVVNFGSIAALSAIGSFVVRLTAGGYMTNAASGIVNAAYSGIYIAGPAATVSNAGLVTAPARGVYLPLGGYLTNLPSGTIAGTAFEAVRVGNGRATVRNAGLLLSANDGVYATAGATVTNSAGGTIKAPLGVLIAFGTGTLFNGGDIDAGTAGTAVSLGRGYSNQLVAYPGATFTGKVNGGNTIGAESISTLELASGASTGVLSGLGKQFVNFARIAIDAGAVWTVTDANTLPAGTTLTNSGSLTQSGGSLVDAGVVINNGVMREDAASVTLAALTGTGQVLIGAFSTLTVTGTVAPTETIVVGPGGEANIDGTVTNAGAILEATNGVLLATGGNVTNLSTGTIRGGRYGIYIKGGAGNTVTNAGIVTGTSSYGVAISGGTTGSSLVNLSTGTIAGGKEGVVISNGLPEAAVTNAGTIMGGEYAAVDLHAGGTVVNQVSGVIQGVEFGIGIGESLNGGVDETVTNAGVVTGTVYYGIGTYGGGVTNASTGVITGHKTGVLMTVHAGTVTNAGTILGTSQYGVFLKAGGLVANQGSGTIGGAFDGIVFTTAPGTVTNAGSITGTKLFGIQLSVGGSVANQSSGSIHGARYGILITQSAGTVTNAGVVTGSGSYGVDLAGGGTVSNLVTGTITGGANGIFVTGAAGTVVSAGTISGATSAVTLTATYTNRVIADPGAVFSGTVDGGNTIGATAVSTLELASGASAGTMSGLGTQFVNFAQTTIDAGAVWTLIGANTLAAGTTLANAGTLTLLDGSLTDAGSVINNGLIQENNATLTVAALTGTGEVSIGPGAALTVTGSVSATETIVLGAGGVLTVNGTVTNAGGIPGTGDYGIGMSGGGVTNLSMATIAGHNTGIWIHDGTGTVNNAGAVTGTKLFGVLLSAGGYVANRSAAAIRGGRYGILIAGGAGTVTNAGTVSGGTAAVTLTAGYTNRVIADPGAVFSGAVDGGNTIGAASVSTLELASGAAAGLISGLGTQFVNFAQTTIDAGAVWGLTDANTMAAGTTLTNNGALSLLNASLSDAGNVINNGLIQLNAGTLTVGTLSGTGKVAIGGGGTLTVTGSVAAGETVAISGTGVLNIQSTAPAAFAGQTVLSDGAAIISQGATNTVSGTSPQAASVTVNGTGSSWTAAGQQVIGGGGLGSLAIQAGATATAGGGAVIADTAAASGSAVTLSGTGSNWQIAGALVVGNAGEGSMSLSQGATVKTNLGAIIGNQTGSDGSGVTVAGVGARWDIGGELDVGNAAAGGLTIVGGATVEASQGQVGLAVGGSGNINIQGADSNLIIDNDLFIGVTGTGVLTLGNNTKLTVVDNLVIGKFGVINQFGGIIDPTNAFVAGTAGPTGGTTASKQVGNTGTIFAANGTYTVTAPVINGAISGGGTGTGVLQIQTGGDLVLNAAVDSSQTVAFTANTGTLTVGNIGVTSGLTEIPGPVTAIGSFTPAAISGFQHGDTIVVNTASAASFVLNGSAVAVTDGASTTFGTLTFSTAAAAQEAVNSLATASPELLAQVACFAAGTRIATVDGPVAVESLRVGDVVTTVLGGPGRIVWVGSRTIDTPRHPRPESVWPVRICRNAFGPGLPERALFVSPDHALYVDGVLIPARLLINGTSVAQVKRKTVIYHHVELARHDVLLAEGLPAESYLDTGDRAKFSGGAVVTLHPDFAARTWEMEGCAPLILAGALVESVRRRIAEPRAARSTDLSGRSGNVA